MDSDSGYRCWEMMSCDNLDCPARHEPETPCWEIAKRNATHHNVSKNCEDCMVYILKAEAYVSSINKLKNFNARKEFWEKIELRHQDCIQQDNSMSSS